MNEPSELQVGHLIDLKCGHTQRPTDVESVMFAVHLEAAGFVKGKGVVGSPQRSILNSISISGDHSVSSSRQRVRKAQTIVKVNTPFPPTKKGISVRSRSNTFTQINPKIAPLSKPASQLILNDNERLSSSKLTSNDKLGQH